MARRDWYCEDVLSGKIDVQRVYEDDHVLAFHHPSPAAEVHVVVIPKSHVPSLLDPTALDGDLLSSMGSSNPSNRNFGRSLGGQRILRAGECWSPRCDATYALACPWSRCGR